MNANKRVSRPTLKSDLARVDRHKVGAEEFEELPEFTDEMLARATVNKGADTDDGAPQQGSLNRGLACGR